VWENLEHPGVAALYEVIATDDYFAFVCEYAAKGDLLEHIRENGRLKGKDAKRVCSQLIAAIECVPLSCGLSLPSLWFTADCCNRERSSLLRPLSPLSLVYS
jgi:hypothetical protein